MLTRLLVIAAIFLVACCDHGAMALTIDFDGIEYTATTAEDIQIAWDASKIGDGEAAADCADCEYEVRIYHVERQSYTDVGTTTGLTKLFRLLKTGHYTAEVRACRGADESRHCSEWASSVSEANRPMVAGEHKKWRIYGRPAKSGSITITK